MKKKTIFTVAIMLTICLISFVGCDKKKEENKKQITKAPISTTPTTKANIVVT